METVRVELATKSGAHSVGRVAIAVPTTSIGIDSNCTLVAGFDAFGNRNELAENTLVIAEIDRENMVRHRMPPQNVMR